VFSSLNGYLNFRVYKLS